MTHQRRELITNLQFHFRIQWRAFVAIALRGPPKAPSACPRETTSNIRDTSWPARHLVTLAKRTSNDAFKLDSQGIEKFPARSVLCVIGCLLAHRTRDLALQPQKNPTSARNAKPPCQNSAIPKRALRSRVSEGNAKSRRGEREARWQNQPHGPHREAQPH